jgi:GT2 family glycosyltransferase
MLLETLRTLSEQTCATEIVVVDNGSSDGSVQAVRRGYPDAHVIELGSNRGFGPALNAAVSRHPAELLVFSNNDVRYEPRFVEALLDGVGGTAASVAGVLLQGDDPGLIDSAGVVVDSTLLAFDYLHGLPVAEAEGAPPPLGPTGGAALVPLAAFEATGGFDERIFAYLEDVDLALRLLASGLPCRLAHAARGIHSHSSTLGSGSAAKNRLMGWSRGYILRRYGTLRNPGRALRALTAEAVICAGQAVVDGNVSGVVGRVSGWRAARGLPTHPIPSGATLDVGFKDALRWRAARRFPRRI